MRRVFVATVVLAAMATAAPASATVRRCVDRVTSGPQQAASMMQGRKVAIEAWSKAAAALGNGYGEWRNAGTRSLVCGPAPISGVVCEARAHPCAVEAARKQVPSVKSPLPEPRSITVPAPSGKAI